jgi:XTP/dITP diphosphohydrolase
MPLLVLGTSNRKKAIELRDLLEPLGFELETLTDFPNALSVEETGHTFAENAALKAIQQAKHLGQWVLGEDSGLSVDALGGAPGVYSARYAGLNDSGVEATDEANNEKLLRELARVPLEKRAAYYVCHATLSDPSGQIRADSEGHCHGRILLKPSGTEGFGYDPLFEIPEFHRTFGQLGLAVKGVLSHRSRALRALIPQLIRLRDGGAW